MIVSPNLVTRFSSSSIYADRLRPYPFERCVEFWMPIVQGIRREVNYVEAVVDVVKGGMARYGKLEELLTDCGFVFY